MFSYTLTQTGGKPALARPSKPAEERLVTLSVRLSRASLDLLGRVVEGEASYLGRRGLPTRGIHRSTAFRTIWELGELEYLLQRATLWVTRRTNRYSIDQAAQLLGWDVGELRRLLRERGLVVPEPGPGAGREAPGTSP